MAQTFMLASYCLGYMAICLSGYEVTACFEIEREKYDTFQNLLCQTSQLCTNDQCKSYRAECIDNTCKRCRCGKDGRYTFVTSGSNTANCTKDEDIIPESIPRKSFRLEKIKGTRLNLCLTVAKRGNNTIFGKDCTSSPNMRWVSIKTRNGNFQLMNVMTLQCLEFVEEQPGCESKENNATGEVAIKQCKKRNGQYMVQDNHNLYASKLCGGKKYYLKLGTKKRGEGYQAYSDKNEQESWFNEDKNLQLHWEHIPYRGCYRFQNGGFMLNLDSKACRGDPCSHQFFAPIFSHNKNCRINWSKSKILCSTAATWQNVSGNMNTNNQFFSIQRKSNDTQMLQVFHKALQKFSGSLFRLAISCENEMHPKRSEDQCLLLKFTFLRRITTNASPGAESTTDRYHGNETTTTSTSTTVKLKRQDTEQSSINAVAIAVPVSLLAAILVVILFYFVYYRRQKRGQKLLTDQEQNQPSVLVPPATIEPLASKQPSQYEVPCERQYEYVDQTALTLPPIPLTYDYATADKALKHDREAKVAPERTGSYVIERSDTGKERINDGYVIERLDSGEDGTHDNGYVIERSDTGEEDTHDGGYVIEKPDNEGDTYDRGYVITRPNIKEASQHDDCVIGDESNFPVVG